MDKFNKTFKELMESISFKDLEKEYKENKKEVPKTRFFTIKDCKETFQNTAKKYFNENKNKDGNKKFKSAYFKNNNFGDRDCWFKYEENGELKEMSIKIDEFV